MFQDFLSRAAQLREQFENLKNTLHIEGHRKRKEELSLAMSEENFFKRPEAEDIVAELKEVSSVVEEYEVCEKMVSEMEALLEILKREEDPEMVSEADRILNELDKRMSGLRKTLLFSGEHDKANVYLSVHSGTGGKDASDWADMLLRMYMRYAMRKGLKTELVYVLPSEEGGIKSATVYIKGRWAYGCLRGEAGVHRLVRLSPFDAAHRRHTSFASVDVTPEIDTKIEVTIRKEDLRIETFHASGPGGQHVNITDSAVRITHIPTGIVVSCQQERSQHMNRRVAMNILRARLYQLEERKKREQLEKLQGEKGEASWGNQIRSYILHPYTLVKDHRTGVETSNAKAVLDGEIDDFIESFLTKDYKERLSAQMKKSNKQREKKTKD
jgi:peptide chain release factor 2